MNRKIKIPLLLTAGVAATAYGMLRENNLVFIAGIVMAFTGYRLIRRNLKNTQQIRDTSEIHAPSDEE